LRLIAEENGLEVGGPAWIIRARSDAGPSDGSSHTDNLPEALAATPPQISFVLQDPPRLAGSIVRRFSAVGNRSDDLDGIVQLVGSRYDEFALIATQVRTAEMSGVARRFGERVLIEVGFGAFVPKGVVTTSQYVCTPSGSVVEAELNLQEQAFHIEDGRPKRVALGRAPGAVRRAVRQICRAVSVASAHYEQPSVEFGVEA
nr:hypothetical protein [Streptomyces sp. SID7803]